MSSSFASLPTPDRRFDGSVQVQRPTPVQAIGGVLAQAFDADASLPDDIAKLLAALDQVSPSAPDRR